MSGATAVGWMLMRVCKSARAIENCWRRVAIRDLLRSVAKCCGCIVNIIELVSNASCQLPACSAVAALSRKYSILRGRRVINSSINRAALTRSCWLRDVVKRSHNCCSSIAENDGARKYKSNANSSVAQPSSPKPIICVARDTVVMLSSYQSGKADRIAIN